MTRVTVITEMTRVRGVIAGGGGTGEGEEILLLRNDKEMTIKEK